MYLPVYLFRKRMDANPTFYANFVESTIEDHADLEPLFKKFGKRYKAAPGFSNEDILLIALYLIELMTEYSDFPDRRLDQEGILKVYARIGGDPSVYNSMKEPLHEAGYIGFNQYILRENNQPFFGTTTYEYGYCPTLTSKGVVRIE